MKKQNFYCTECNKLIPVSINIDNTKTFNILSDTDLEVDLIAKVSCPNCGNKTSVILDTAVTDIVVLLNRYGFKTTSSSGSDEIFIIFDYNIKFPRKICKSIPEPWVIKNEYVKIFKNYFEKRYVIRLDKKNFSVNEKVRYLVQLENFIYTKIINKVKNNG